MSRHFGVFDSSEVRAVSFLPFLMRPIFLEVAMSDELPPLEEAQEKPREEKTLKERSRNGVPLPGGTIRNLRSVAERFDIKLPPGMQGIK